MVNHSAKAVVCPIPGLIANQQQDERCVRGRVRQVAKRCLDRRKTLPLTSSACSDLRLTWSSAVLGPWIAVRLPATRYQDRRLCSGKVHGVIDLVAPHPPIGESKTTTPEISSAVTVVPVTGRTNSVPQDWSSPSRRLTLNLIVLSIKLPRACLWCPCPVQSLPFHRW